MNKNIVVISPKVYDGIRELVRTDLLHSGLHKGEELASRIQYAKLVTLDEAKPGDIVEFQHCSFLGNTINWFISLFDKDFDKYGFHLAVFWGHNNILEAIPSGVRITNIQEYIEKSHNFRIWRLLDKETTQKQLNDIAKKYTNIKYDWKAYFWTLFAYLFDNRRQKKNPALTNSAYTCWELVFFILYDLGFSFKGYMWQYPMLNEFNRLCRGIGSWGGVELKERFNWAKVAITHPKRLWGMIKAYMTSNKYPLSRKKINGISFYIDPKLEITPEVLEEIVECSENPQESVYTVYRDESGPLIIY